MPSMEELALDAEREVGRMNAFFPILPRIGNLWAATRPWEGRTIAVNLHLTTISGALLKEMTLGGGTCVVSAASPATTDPGTVGMLRNLGIEVYTGGDLEDRHLQVLSHDPDLLVDVGFDLIHAVLTRRRDLAPRIRGAVEITRSGITRLRASEPPFPVINVNDGRLKNAVENRHGVPAAIWQGVTEVTGMHLGGRRCAVVGYGPVGKGLATYGRAVGMGIEVVENQPIRRLYAHYDGFPTCGIEQALERSQFIVTATGARNVITTEHLASARDGLVLLNAGHGGDEIDLRSLKDVADRVDNVADQVVRYRLPDGRRITVLGGGHPLNIVLNSGSPEPILLQFAVLGLALERLSRQDFAAGEVVVPEDIETRAAELALEAMEAVGS